nr:MAG TPA: hypothetical protein [Bacteriophage sp.]
MIAALEANHQIKALSSNSYVFLVTIVLTLLYIEKCF